jgi:DNA-binding protein Fis
VDHVDDAVAILTQLDVVGAALARREDDLGRDDAAVDLADEVLRRRCGDEQFDGEHHAGGVACGVVDGDAHRREGAGRRRGVGERQVKLLRADVVGRDVRDGRVVSKEALRTWDPDMDFRELDAMVSDYTRQVMIAAIQRCAGNKQEAAKLLGVKRATFYYRLKELGIQ